MIISKALSKKISNLKIRKKVSFAVSFIILRIGKKIYLFKETIIKYFKQFK